MAYYKCGSIHPTQNSNVVVDTASGAIANFQTPLALPLVKIKFDVNAVQESGTPTPVSPLPISGWSEISLVKCGSNLWNREWEEGAISNTTGLDYSSTNYWRTVGLIPIKPNTEYYICSPTGVSGNSIGLRFYGADKSYVGYTVKSGYGAINRSFVSPDNAYFLRFNPTNANCPNHDISLNYPSTDTTYHNTYNGNTEVINLGGTYYGGHFTQDKNGKMEITVTHGTKKFGDINFTRSNNQGLWEAYLFYALMNEKKRGQAVKSSSYEAVVSGLSTVPDLKLVAPLTNDYIYIRDDNYTDAQTFKTANANTVLLYELSEPFTIALPDGTPIKSLPGINNIFCDTGDTSLQFHKIG